MKYEPEIQIIENKHLSEKIPPVTPNWPWSLSTLKIWFFHAFLVSTDAGYYRNLTACSRLVCLLKNDILTISAEQFICADYETNETLLNCSACVILHSALTRLFISPHCFVPDCTESVQSSVSAHLHFIFMSNS